MIHQLFNLTRPLIVFDTETTGTDTVNDRIVELAFQVWTAEGLQKEYRTLVNPGISIPAEVTEIHGIKDDDFLLCRTCAFPLLGHPIGASDECVDHDCVEPRGWPTFKQLASNIVIGFTGCDFAGKNIRFDLRILAAEMQRAGQAWNYADARVIDADRLEALLNPRSLSHLYKKYTDKELEDAHSALVDVQASTTVLEYQMQWHGVDGEPLPRDIDALHELQWTGWIDSEGSFRFVNGVPCFGRWGKHAGKPMNKVDVGYYDFILKGMFSAEVKTIAANAKMGKFPVQKEKQ